jgi:hypothetical protein
MSEQFLIEHFVIVGYILGLLIISGAVSRAIAVLAKDASEVLVSVKEFREAFAIAFLSDSTPVASHNGHPWWNEPLLL